MKILYYYFICMFFWGFFLNYYLYRHIMKRKDIEIVSRFELRRYTGLIIFVSYFFSPLFTLSLKFGET